MGSKVNVETLGQAGEAPATAPPNWTCRAVASRGAGRARSVSGASGSNRPGRPALRNFSPRGAAETSMDTTIIGTVLAAPPVRVGRTRANRRFCAFAVRCETTGHVFKVTLRGKQAGRAAAVLGPGVVVRLTGSMRVVAYFKADRIAPAVERFKATLATNRATHEAREA